jgi:hypothetical protein
MFFEISLLRRFDRPSGHYQVNFYLKETIYFFENIIYISIDTARRADLEYVPLMISGRSKKVPKTGGTGEYRVAKTNFFSVK